MANQTIRVLRLDKPANNLAVWLAGHHPDLFLAVLKRAQTLRPRLKGLGDDGISFDTTVAVPEINLEPVTIDQAALDTMPSTFLTDANSAGAGFLSSLADTASSVGSTIGDGFESAESGMLSALGSAGKFLQTAAGQTTLATLARTLAPTQQQVVQTQLARTTVGTGIAPITYQNGLPVYSTTTQLGTIYQPLTRTGIAGLAPSDISVMLARYGGYIAVAAVALVGVALARKVRT